MRANHRWALAAASLPVAVRALSLTDVCTTSYVQTVLPANGFYQGITIDSTSVTTNVVSNYSATGSYMYPDAVISFCNVTFAYTHNGRNDKVLLKYWLPAPGNYQNRFLTTGGGGLAINSGEMSLPGGIEYGAAAGITDGGFGGFTKMLDSVFLLANGTVNWQSVYMFGYQAIHEMTVLGKEFTALFFNASDTKQYTYYQACSEGGREGWSQVQRFGDQFDGAIIGAPALRYGQQQTQHLFSNVVEKTLGYYPSTCEFAKIVNLTITACDPLDGKTDGVVSRSDLCKLKFNLNSTIGQPYYCAASSAAPSFKQKRQMGGAAAATIPAQNGTVTALGVQVVSEIIDGLFNSKGERGYFSYQPAASIVDGATSYNATSGTWGLDISGLGGEWVARFLELQNVTTLPSLDNVTYDTLVYWMTYGMNQYADSLQTTYPDLTPFYEAGGKVLHYHGESDNSIPPASSVRYWESVRSVMYTNMTYNESATSIKDWYRLFLVPGAAHCAPNTAEPNGGFPQTNMAVMIDWVENGVVPETLNATVLLGENKGEKQQVCAWPLRPYWTGNGTTMECEYDQASIDSWIYDLNAYKTPVY